MSTLPAKHTQISWNSAPLAVKVWMPLKYPAALFLPMHNYLLLMENQQHTSLLSQSRCSQDGDKFSHLLIAENMFCSHQMIKWTWRNLDAFILSLLYHLIFCFNKRTVKQRCYKGKTKHQVFNNYKAFNK